MLNDVISYAFPLLELACGIAIVIRFRGSPGAVLGGIAFGTWVATNITQKVLSALDVEWWGYVLWFTLPNLAGYGCLLAALMMGRVHGQVQAGPGEQVASSTGGRMRERPKSVSVVSWLLIVFSISGLVVMLGTAVAIEFDSRFMPIIIAGGVASLLQVAMGVGMLNGKNWARLLFLWLTPVSIIIGFLGGRVSPGSVIKIVWYIIFAVYLTKPAAVTFFTGTRTRGRVA